MRVTASFISRDSSFRKFFCGAHATECAHRPACVHACLHVRACQGAYTGAGCLGASVRARMSARASPSRACAGCEARCESVHSAPWRRGASLRPAPPIGSLWPSRWRLRPPSSFLAYGVSQPGVTPSLLVMLGEGGRWRS